MKIIRVLSRGQISLPADIRRRWATDSLVIEDLGNRVVLRPMPADPIGAALGSLRGGGKTSSSKARARVRREETHAERRKYQR